MLKLLLTLVTISFISPKAFSAEESKACRAFKKIKKFEYYIRPESTGTYILYGAFGATGYGFSKAGQGLEWVGKHVAMVNETIETAAQFSAGQVTQQLPARFQNSRVIRYMVTFLADFIKFSNTEMAFAWGGWLTKWTGRSVAVFAGGEILLGIFAAQEAVAEMYKTVHGETLGDGTIGGAILANPELLSNGSIDDTLVCQAIDENPELQSLVFELYSTAKKSKQRM